jgi:hypothetical protein
LTDKELKSLFDIVDEDKRAFALDTLDEYIFFKNEIKTLRELPLIRFDRKNPEKQIVTPAGKLIKEYSQVIDAKRATLLRILYRVESTAADELLAKLAEFEQ